MNKTKRVFCPFCARPLHTSQGISSHIQQTGCNKQSGLVPLLSYLSALGSNRPLPPESSVQPDTDNRQSNDTLPSESSIQPDTVDPRSYGYVQLQEPISNEPFTIPYPEAARVLGPGKTALDLFNEDHFSEYRQTNLYYPFASKAEWEVAQYLIKSPLSLADIDEFLKLELVSQPVICPVLFCSTLTIFLGKKDEPLFQNC